MVWNRLRGKEDVVFWGIAKKYNKMDLAFLPEELFYESLINKNGLDSLKFLEANSTKKVNTA